MTGQSRSGKTESASRWAADKPRVVAWDPQLDWVKFGLAPIDQFDVLCRELALNATTPARIAYKGPLRPAEFSRFAAVAYCWGKLEPCLVIAEELAWITHPGKAPQGWLELVTGGLKFGIDLLSITQRPAESDKTALSQSTIIRCFAQDRFEDARYMARELRVDVEQIDALEPLHYIEKNKRTKKTAVNRVTF